MDKQTFELRFTRGKIPSGGGYVGLRPGQLVDESLGMGLGLVESFSSFFASAYKEAIVFTVILPVLLWLSIKHRRAGGEA